MAEIITVELRGEVIELEGVQSLDMLGNLHVIDEINEVNYEFIEGQELTKEG